MSKMKMSQSELAELTELEKKYKKYKIGINFEEEEVSAPKKEKKEVELDKSQRNEILNYFLTHKETESIFKRFNNDEFNLHEGISTRFREYMVKFNEKNNKYLFSNFRISALPNGRGICLNYPYESSLLIHCNFIPEMRSILKERLTEELNDILKRFELYNESILNSVNCNVPMVEEERIFQRLEQVTIIDLEKLFSAKYRTIIETEGHTLINRKYNGSLEYQLLRIGGNFLVGKEEWENLIEYLEYHGPIKHYTPPPTNWNWD